MKLSIFAKRAFLNTNPNQDFDYHSYDTKYDGTTPQGYLKRVSSIIRADQICEATGALLNPKTTYKNGVCVYVKPDIGPDFKFEGKRSYLDVIDGWYYMQTLKDNPKVGAIVCSEQDYFYLANQNIPNKIILIPQHHINYKREPRTRKEVTRVGVIGSQGSWRYLPPELKLLLNARGMELFTTSSFFTRQDIIDFYKQIDIQIVWRPYRKKLANPLKIVNAASFGIPTIALDEIYFREVANCYIGVSDFSQFLVELDRLRNSPSLYKAYSGLCLAKAENYHIDRIAALYKKL